MNKEQLTYGLLGIVAGLVLGFYAGNWATPAPGSGAALSKGEEAQSVNSGGPSKELPPNHPAVNGDVVPAPPLPEGAGASTPNMSAATGPELPSLDPLPTSSKDERAEHKFKNIQVLKGLPADRITKIMFAFKASLGVECTYCHIKDEFDKDDKPQKQMARKMIGIVRDANDKLGVAGRVTCFTCHRGQERPAK